MSRQHEGKGQRYGYNFLKVQIDTFNHFDKYSKNKDFVTAPNRNVCSYGPERERVRVRTAPQLRNVTHSDSLRSSVVWLRNGSDARTHTNGTRGHMVNMFSSM